MNKQQKLDLAKEICTSMFTKFEVIKIAGTVNNSRVLKTCLSDPTHPTMEVSLGSIISLNRGGCATCARIRGGQISKRTKVKT
jgi:hypothetical protein